MALTDFEICSRALVNLGENTINSFSENTSRSRICGLIYPEYIRTLITLYPWKFSLKKVQLAKLVSTPINKWKYKYQLPSDLLILRGVYNSIGDGAPVITSYEIFDGELYTSEEYIYIDYQYEVDESEFPSYFAEFAIKAMASELAMPITQDKDLAAIKRQEAFGLPSDNGEGGFYGKAKRLDGMQNPTSSIESNDLLIARIGY